MEFRQIESFVNAVKYKSFSKAADAAFLTQPTISAHISNLERELGIPLLNRSGRDITLTPQGEAFYPHAIAILNSRSQALYSIKNLSTAMDGVLELQTSSIPGQYYLPAVMEQFHRQYPNVRFYVEQSGSKTVIENILNQKGEIGFTGCKGDNELDYEPVFTDETVLIVPDSEKYAGWENGSRVDFELFKEEKFILRDNGSGTKEEMERTEVNGKPLLSRVQVIAHMNNMEAIKQAVASGLGISILTRRAIENSVMKHPFKYFLIEGLEKKRSFYMVYNRKICLSPAAEAFRNLVLSVKEAE